ncbi:MAG: PQQ-binding-like beta-propeller repeat protein [Verrucomicrobiales bacterium]|nr:PQQ-binding-like beta-propeller repeat protein [Verrucomicrobiales bacterium]
MRASPIAALILTTLLVPVLGGVAEPFWPQFRGPNGQGVSREGRPPVVFGATTNALWRTPVEPGLSSPVIVGDRLFLTTFQTGTLSVVSFDRRDGRRQWQWTVPAGPIGDVHTASSPAAPSPAASADKVFAYFGSWGLVALTHEGRETWRRSMDPPKNRYGVATSPVLHGSNVLLVLDADDLKSSVLALNAEDGQVVWQTERPGQRATWSTPAIVSTVRSGRSADELIVLSALRLSAYDPLDGRLLWAIDGFPQETVSVPVVGRGRVFASAAALGGRGNEQYDAMGWKQLVAFDQNADGLIQFDEVPENFRMVLRPDLPKDHSGYAVPFPFRRDFKNRDSDQDGALSEAEWQKSVTQWEASSRPLLMAVTPGDLPAGQTHRTVWKSARGLPEMPSILLHEDRLFFVRDGGLLSCVDPDDGRLIYQERIGAAGQYCASPIAVPGRVYLSSVAGVITVVDSTANELRVLARNELNEPIHATPAIAGNALYVRTASHLFSFAGAAP